MSASCRGCGASQTIEAHLIPRAFVHDMRSGQKSILIGSATRKGRKVSQSGLIDRNILCAKCDGHLGQYDTFGVNFSRTFAAKSRLVWPDIFRVHPADTESLVRFFVSILWRCSISNLDEAKEVNLGTFEDKFRDVLFSGVSCATEPETVLYRYKSRVIKAQDIVLLPFKSPFVDGTLDAYSVSMGGFRAFVKVDERSLPRRFRPMMINGKSEIIGGYLYFEKTQEFRATRAIAQNMSEKPTKRGPKP
jgi:hypothetical protein